MSSEIAQKEPADTKRKMVGIGYLIGDAALFANGMMEAMAATDPTKKKNAIGEAITGLGWAVGGVAMAKYGNRSTAKQMEALEQRLAAHFEEQGLALSPEMIEKAKHEKDKGFFAKFEDFCYKYPTEILNAVYGGLSLLLIKSGHHDLKTNGQSATLGMGCTILAGAVAGLFIKEKSKEQLDAAGATGLSRWVQEKPMRVTGGLYLANNAFTINGALNNKKKYADHENAAYRNMYWLRGITAASYIFSNVTLMGTSTSDSGKAELTDAAKQEVLKDTANIILNQPESLREALIQETALYLSKQRELGFAGHTPEKLVEMITANLQQYASKAVEKNDSWVAKTDASAAGNGLGV